MCFSADYVLFYASPSARSPLPIAGDFDSWKRC